MTVGPLPLAESTSTNRVLFYAEDVAGHLSTTSITVMTPNADVTGPLLESAQVSDNGSSWYPAGSILAGATVQLRASVRDPFVSLSRTIGLKLRTDTARPELVSGSGNRLLLHFDETSGTTAPDLSGRNIIFNFNGGPAWVAGNFQGALSFDGVDDYLATPNVGWIDGQPIFTPPRFTLSAWVRPDSSNGFGGILSAGGPWNYHFGLSIGRPIIQVAHTSYGSKYVVCPYPLSAGEWHYLAATFDGSVLSLYVDGTLVGSRNDASMTMQEGFQAYIGKTFGENTYFKGAIDELQLINYAETEAEIRSRYRKSYYAFYSTDEGVSWNPVPGQNLSYGGAIEGQPGPYTLTASSLPLALSMTANKVRLFVEDLAGNLSSATYSVPVGLDTAPPPAPILLQARSGPGGLISLIWQGGEGEPAASYALFRASSVIVSTEGLSALQTSLSGPTYADLPPEDGLYHYALYAKDAQGNASPLSNGLSAVSDRAPPQTQLVFAPPAQGFDAEGRLIISSQTRIGIVSSDLSPSAGTGASFHLVDLSSSDWPFSVFGTSFTLVPGTHTVLYFSRDFAGNADAVDFVRIRRRGRDPAPHLGAHPAGGEVFRRPGGFGAAYSVSDDLDPAPLTQAVLLRWRTAAFRAGLCPASS